MISEIRHLDILGKLQYETGLKKTLNIKQFHGKPLTDVLDEQQILDLYNFEGNAQALRIITKLHRLIGPNGLHLTSSVMDTIIKYPVNSIEKNRRQKIMQTERCYKRKLDTSKVKKILFQKSQRKSGTGISRNPLCFILEAADDLAYTFADLEDGYNKGMYSYDDLLQVIQSAEDSYGDRIIDETSKRCERIRR